MPQSLLTEKEKPTYRVFCLYSSFVHEDKGPPASDLVFPRGWIRPEGVV
jgi:hypothetical protein